MRYVAPSKDEMGNGRDVTRAGGISQCIHTMVESGGTSQGIADCGQCGCGFAIWPKIMTDGVLAAVRV